MSFVENELKGVKILLEKLNGFKNTLDFEGVDVESHLHKGEWNLIHFLESNSYGYSVISDCDFERAIGLDSVETNVFNRHSEYWSKEMKGRLNELVENRVNIVFASGKSMFRQVEYYRDGLKVLELP